MMIVIDRSRPTRARDRQGKIRPLPVLLLLLLASGAAACSRTGSDSRKVVSGPSGFAGRWLASVTRTQNGCGFLEPICIDCNCPIPIEVVDVGSTVLIQSGGRVLTGSVTGGVITFTDTRTWSDDGTCKLIYEAISTGTRTDSGVSGEWVVTLSPIGACDPGYPCESRGTFVWTPCSAETCGPVVCLEAGSGP